MKDAYIRDICVSINHEFAKRCNSEPLLIRLADDLIARYSPKHQPHPDFFKQDAAMALNQLTLYIDQFIQIMRKYQFLEKAASVVSSFTGSCLKINDFLAKQLYIYMKTDKPPHPKQSVHNDLCAACGKLRENEKIRVLREQLDVPRVQRPRKIVRQVLGRNGERYDMEELIQEELDNLDALNEEEVRKRLGMLELDHDRRNQQMLICLQQLGRANDKVTSYNKNLEKKMKEGEGNFNIKEYVFQLSRHFYHSLSNLDDKIKQLKQNLSPIQTVAAQTEEPCISMVEHLEQMRTIRGSLEQLQSNYNDTKTILLIEQQKNKEEDDMIQFLQAKVAKVEGEREDDKLNWTVKENQLNSIITQKQQKLVSLVKVVKRLKGITKAKNLGIDDEELQLMVKTQNCGSQFPEEPAQAPSETDNQEQFRSYIKAMVDSRKSWKQHLLPSPNIASAQCALDCKNTRIKETLSLDSTAAVTPSSKKVPIHFRDTKYQAKLSLFRAFEECVNPSIDSFKSMTPQAQYGGQDSHSLSDINSIPRQNIQWKGELPQKPDKFSRVESTKKGLDKLVVLNNRRSLLVLENEQGLNLAEGEAFREKRKHTGFHLTHDKKQKLKTTLHEHLALRQDANNDGKFLRPQMLVDKRQNQSMLFGYEKRKKRRNFSQEHSFEDGRDHDIRGSIERPEWNEKRIFTELNKVLQVQRAGPELESKKGSKKRSFYTRGQYQKAALSLQEINYSTYVYSLTAKLHLKNPNNYLGLKKFLCVTSGFNCEQQNSIKNSLKIILINHRSCSGNGSICKHMEGLLDKIKTM